MKTRLHHKQNGVLTMFNEKIAILVDSSADIPKEYIDKYKIVLLPKTISFKDKQITDSKNICMTEFYDKLKKEVPTTNVPTAGQVLKLLKRLRLEGYNKAIAITVSSELCGMYNLMLNIANEPTGININVIDTKNIGIGAGFIALYACRLLEEGKSFEEICKKTEDNSINTKVYFCVPTLEYLKKGGKIGLLKKFMGTALNLKPIISCNENGVFYNVAKARGTKNAVNKAIFTAAESAAEAQKCNIAIVHANAKEYARQLSKRVKSLFPHCNVFIQTEVTPSLAAYAGNGLVGICVQKL